MFRENEPYPVTYDPRKLRATRYISTLFLRDEGGLVVLTVLNFFLTVFNISGNCGPWNNFIIRLPLYLKVESHISITAWNRSMERIWSTSLIPESLGEASDRMTAACPSKADIISSLTSLTLLFSCLALSMRLFIDFFAIKVKKIKPKTFHLHF